MSEPTYESARHALATVERLVKEAAADGHPIPDAVAVAMQCQLLLHPSLVGDPHKLQLAAEIALEIHAESEWKRLAGRLLAN